MPETEVEQQPATTEAVKEEKKDMVEESAKIEVSKTKRKPNPSERQSPRGRLLLGRI